MRQAGWGGNFEIVSPIVYKGEAKGNCARRQAREEPNMGPPHINMPPRSFVRNGLYTIVVNINALIELEQEPLFVLGVVRFGP